MNKSLTRTQLTLVLLFLFIFEGSILQWLLPVSWRSGDVSVSPHLVLVIVMLIGIYIHRFWGLAFGLGFGLLHDIVYYGPMIGPYCLAMGFVGYAVGIIQFRSHGNILTSMFMVVVGNLMFETIIYGIYRVFQITHVSPQWVFLRQMFPSVIINLLFALMVYVPMRKWLERIIISEQAEEE